MFVVITDHDCLPQFIFNKSGCDACLCVQDIVELYTSTNRETNTTKIKNLISYSSKCGQKWWNDISVRLKERGIVVAARGEMMTTISEHFDSKDALISEFVLRLWLYLANQGRGPRIYERKEPHKSTEALRIELAYDPFESGTVWSGLLKCELFTWSVLFSIFV